MKLDLLGPEQVARPAQPKQQQSQNLLVKFGLPFTSGNGNRISVDCQKGVLCELRVVGFPLFRIFQSRLETDFEHFVPSLV